MQNLQLYNNQKKESQLVVSTSHISLKSKSDIKDGMTTKQIANVISDRLISHIDKAFEKLSKK